MPAAPNVSPHPLTTAAHPDTMAPMRIIFTTFMVASLLGAACSDSDSNGGDAEAGDTGTPDDVAVDATDTGTDSPEDSGLSDSDEPDATADTAPEDTEREDTAGPLDTSVPDGDGQTTDAQVADTAGEDVPCLQPIFAPDPPFPTFGWMYIDVALDTDNDAATGCSVAGSDDGGAEVLISVFARANLSTPNVLETEVYRCEPVCDTWEPTRYHSYWATPLGLDLGIDSADIAETFVPVADLPILGQTRAWVSMRTGAGGRDALPSFSVDLSAATGAGASDGAIDDWQGYTADGTDPAGDADPADDAADLRALWIAKRGTDLLMRFDVTDMGNDAPTPQDDVASTTVNTAVLIDVLDNDTDPDRGDGLQLMVLTDTPNHGAISTVYDQNQAFIRYTPGDAYTGTDSFEYTVTDKQGLPGTATVVVTTN
ncbi:MAG: hypothetical protein ACI9MR_002003 [Myxococcota bacterium]|jgi:hypothetical protein